MLPAILRVSATISILVITAASSVVSAQSDVYLEAGVPATNRVWAGPEYMRAADVIASGNVALPRYDDEVGKAVLDRLTSPENFALVNNRTIPVDARLKDATLIVGGTNKLLKQYLAEAYKGIRVNRELAQLFVFLLYHAKIFVPLFDEYAASVPDFENQPARVDGRRRIHGGVMSLFSGAELSLSETSYYSDDDVSLMLRGMADSLPAIKVVFAPEFREEIRIKLNEHKARFKASDDLANIDRMLRELESN